MLRHPCSSHALRFESFYSPRLPPRLRVCLLHISTTFTMRFVHFTTIPGLIRTPLSTVFGTSRLNPETLTVDAIETHRAVPSLERRSNDNQPSFTVLLQSAKVLPKVGSLAQGASISEHIVSRLLWSNLPHDIPKEILAALQMLVKNPNNVAEFSLPLGDLQKAFVTHGDREELQTILEKITQTVQNAAKKVCRKTCQS